MESCGRYAALHHGTVRFDASNCVNASKAWLAYKKLRTSLMDARQCPFLKSPNAKPARISGPEVHTSSYAAGGGVLLHQISIRASGHARSLLRR